MKTGLPGLKGGDHIGFTVPNLEEATRFFVEVIGCEVLYELGPFQADDDWMSENLNVHPRAVIHKYRMLKCHTGPSFEIFEYSSPDQNQAQPKNSDYAGHHLAFYVENIDVARQYLASKGVEILGDVKTVDSGPTQGLSWLYFLSPWGMQLELVSYNQGLGFEQGGLRQWSPIERNTNNK
ncbi:VOC family protein [Vibrio sp. NTOU-M3]|uniref:VOC family protein n=1 Tax=Vibrio sp. NTOU-M3 TaxID=3234954 RepID=UPI00349F9EF9